MHAERQLAAIEAATVPYMSEVSQKKTLEKYSGAAGRKTAQHRRLGDALAQIPMRIVTEPKK